METVKISSNWTTSSDGRLEQSDIKIYNVDAEGVYDIEILQEALGVVLETDFYGKHAVVKAIDNVDSFVQSLIKPGHVLVSVNNHGVLNEDFEDIVMFINMLRLSGTPRRMRFLDPVIFPIAVYEERMALQSKSNKDMYGFLRTVEYLQNERHNYAANISDVSKRDMEWVSYLKSVGGTDNLKPSGSFKSSKELKLMVRRGIPAAYRSSVWKSISLSSRRQKLFPTDYYERLVSQIKYMDPKVADDIDKDLNRTFPDHEYFGPGKGRESLRHVLCCFAIHNTDVAYCQSLNFITGNILFFMEEEDTFWLLSTIVECLLPPGQYSRTMIGTYIDQAVLGHLLKTRCPLIHSVFEQAEIQLSVVTIQWFMCIFVNTLRPEACLRVWDMFLNEGSKVLFRIALGLLKINEPKFIKYQHDTGELYNILKSVGDNIVDIDSVIRVAYKDYDDYLKSVTGRFNLNSSQHRNSWRLNIAKDVPSKLVGIGLAHQGPVVDGVEISVDNSTSQSSVEDQSRIRNQSMSVGYSEFLSSLPGKKDAEKKVKKKDYNCKVESHRRFYREDIRLLRLQCHPEVEERFRSMEEARHRWKEQCMIREAAAWELQQQVVDDGPFGVQESML